MGLTFKRMAFGALALAAVLLPMRKPAAGGATAANDDHRAVTLDSLEVALERARQLSSALDVRDSAMRIAATNRSDAVPPVFLRGFPAGTPATESEAMVAGLWRRIGPSDPQVTTSVLVYNIQPFGISAYTGAMISQDGDQTRCIAIAPMNPATANQGPRRLGNALAPCALLAAFGPPGASVRAWLSATRFSAALSNEWLVPEPSEYGAGPWIGWQNNLQGINRFGGIFLWLSALGALDVARLMQPPYEYGASGLRCIGGGQSDCVEGVLHPQARRFAAAEVPADLTLSPWQLRPDTITVGTVRPPSPSMIAAMITEFGRERFRRFWRSNQPFEPAFQDAFGEPLGAWLLRWSQREWQATFRAKHVNAEILLGVTLKPSWLPLLLAWTAVALAIAATVARRRTA